MVLTKVEVSGVKFDVDVSTLGHFSLRDSEGATIVHTADTLEKAKAQARTVLRKRNVEVEVPFIVVQRERFGGGMKFVRGIARAIEAGPARNVLVTYEDGVKGKIDHHPTVFAAVTPEDEITEFIRQTTIAHEARAKAYTIENKHSIVLTNAVRDAVNAAVQNEAKGEAA